MPKPIEIFLETGGSTTWDLSQDQTGDAQEICYPYGWSISPIPVTTPNNATYTLEVSNDGSTWDPYSSLSEDVSVEDQGRGSRFDFLYIRVVTTSSGGSGNCQFKLVLKK